MGKRYNISHLWRFYCWGLWACLVNAASGMYKDSYSGQ
jgi:hypothetical protein